MMQLQLNCVYEVNEKNARYFVSCCQMLCSVVEDCCHLVVVAGKSPSMRILYLDQEYMCII